MIGQNDVRAPSYDYAALLQNIQAKIHQLQVVLNLFLPMQCPKMGCH